MDDGLHTIAWNGETWSGWVGFGGGIKEEPECVSWGLNRIDCFVRGMDDALHTVAWNGQAWSAWVRLGGAMKNRPSCVSWGENRIDCFTRGMDDGLQTVAWPCPTCVVTPSDFGVSVLTLNLRGIHEKWGGVNEEAGAAFIPWRQRYDRVAIWMQITKTTPDVIALQEVYAHDSCPLSPVNLYDYDTLFEMISQIRARTNVTYRIAYLSARHVPHGLCNFWAGHAVLYNPARLNNTTSAGASFVHPYDYFSILEPHLRRSFPCANPSEKFRNWCSLIDGVGLHWLGAYRQNGNLSFGYGPSAVQFELLGQPGFHIHIYNVHIDSEDWFAREALHNLVDSAERTLSSRLYPPIAVGDFNISLQHMQEETTKPQGHFRGFGILVQPKYDVVAVMLGKQSVFLSKYVPKWDHSILPTYNNEGRAEENDPYCGTPPILWSDHCALFVRFSPP
jgi:hypothetical protein